MLTISFARIGSIHVPLALSLALAACIPAGPVSVTRAVTVSDGAVIITGPSGYCIDRAATRDGPDGAFVLFGTCAALAGSRAAGQPEKPALLTVSVLPGAPDDATLSDSFPALTSFFRSEPGRAALSRSGKATDVTVETVLSTGNALLLELRDASAAQGQPVAPDYWRAVLALNGRMVTVSALALSDRPLTSGEKRKALESLIARIRAANAA
jgi:hypothetical protein